MAIEPNDDVDSGSFKYVVISKATGDILPGEPSLALIEESYKTDLGYVNAVCVDRMWILAPAVLGEGLIVYVDKLRPTWDDIVFGR